MITKEDDIDLKRHTTQYEENTIICCWNKKPSMVLKKPKSRPSHFPHNSRAYMTILFIIKVKGSHAHQMAI